MPQRRGRGRSLNGASGQNASNRTNRGRGRGLQSQNVHNPATTARNLRSQGPSSGTGQISGNSSVPVGVALGGGSNGPNTTNSSSDDICGLCTNPVGNDSIGCDFCPRWFHPTTICTGLKQETIDYIEAGSDDGMCFKCSFCRCSGNDTDNNQTNSLEGGTLGQLLEMIRALTINVTSLANQVSALSRSPVVASDSSPNSDRVINTREQLYAELWEFEERRKRKESLIVRGTGSGPTTEFQQHFSALSSALTGAPVPVDDVYCISAERSMFRIKIRDSSMRSNLLRKARELKDHNLYSNVYISRDLTYKQRQDLRDKRLARTNGLQSDQRQAVSPAIQPSLNDQSQTFQ